MKGRSRRPAVPKNPTRTRFGAFLRARRLELGLSLSALVERCNTLAPEVRGFSLNTIRFWETGHERRVPILAQFDVLAEVFKLTDAQCREAMGLAREDVSDPLAPLDEVSAAPPNDSDDIDPAFDAYGVCP